MMRDEVGNEESLLTLGWSGSTDGKESIDWVETAVMESTDRDVSGCLILLSMSFKMLMKGVAPMPSPTSSKTSYLRKSWAGAPYGPSMHSFGKASTVPRLRAVSKTLFISLVQSPRVRTCTLR